MPDELLWALVTQADRPSLNVILLGEPARSRERAERRGLYSRFHRGGAEAGVDEAARYQMVAEELATAGYDVRMEDIGERSGEEVAAVLATVVCDGWTGSQATAS